MESGQITATLLVVEDDAAIGQLIADALGGSMDGRYHVLHAGNRDEAKGMLGRVKPDLVILDLALPTSTGDIDPGEGLLLYRDLRSIANVPVLICSAKTRSGLIGLTLGADDFIAKPFDTDELETRVAALLNRSTASRLQENGYDRIKVGELVIDTLRRHVTLGGRELDLTPSEYALLSTLASHPDTVVSRDTLGQVIRGPGRSLPTKALDQHMMKLRKKLHSEGRPVPAVVTVVGIGYKLASQGKLPSRQGPVPTHLAASAPTLTHGHYTNGGNTGHSMASA